jgi:hypothetical protein
MKRTPPTTLRYAKSMRTLQGNGYANRRLGVKWNPGVAQAGLRTHTAPTWSADWSGRQSVPPHSCLDTHGRCAGDSTRVREYGVSGGRAGPRRGLPRFRRVRHLDRRVAPKSK